MSEEFLGEVASRCEFTGGQIRNATLHAALPALDNGGVVKTAIPRIGHPPRIIALEL